MQLIFHSVSRGTALLLYSATPMLAGLVLLLAALLFPGLTACTGMALVALGATNSTRDRLGISPSRGPLFAAHALIYSAIYLLFIGATLDAAERSGIPLSGLAKLDLAASCAIVTIAARNAIRAILVPLRTGY